MATGNFFNSDLFRINNVIRNIQIIFPKELLLSALREYFAKDSKFHYVKDAWGYPNTPDHTDLAADAGTNDDITTRIYIGQESRMDIPFYPAVLVKNTKSTFIPISFNEEKECIQYDYRLFIDENGKAYNIQVPVGFIFAGAYDLGFSIEVLAEGPQDRATIIEAISILFQSLVRDQLMKAGLFIKAISSDGESSDVYQNDLIYKQSISLDCRGEYRRLVPIENIIEVINVCIEFGDIKNNNPDPNLQINFTYDLNDLVLNAQPV